MILQSQDYELDITEVNNAFTYSLRNKNSNELVLFGSNYTSEESIIEELSELNTSLRSIFG